ncbi:hypothetical protein BU14_0375s0012 [Porphyra umbilicalis]|uniref:Hedgehog protein Hint domain-containing protein n=1 Tax=Porphyra umbilicalis TaxID=2786 RepID=A0A1X6NX66_PORUM|nr:hypothetical protein BU14_0375s0012 [Porphyra umbilicalis]|eukprot:OSX73125.1 hypothetical protein BU14_0375s0012 [Porphyra umbilicalis]
MAPMQPVVPVQQPMAPLPVPGHGGGVLPPMQPPMAPMPAPREVPLEPGAGGEPTPEEEKETTINPTCFPGSASVTRSDGTAVALREVDTGDALVVDAAGGTPPVFRWSHRLPAGQYPSVRLRTASGGALTASAGHLIYASHPRRVDPHANTGVARGKRQCAPDTDAGTQAVPMGRQTHPRSCPSHNDQYSR